MNSPPVGNIRCKGAQDTGFPGIEQEEERD
jgi:hypothetical protein